MSTLRMRMMEEGQAGSIKAVKASGELGRRIRDMGLVPGTRIRIQGRGPAVRSGGPEGYGLHPDLAQ